MPYLIDGHNLIPHVGLRLEAVDDELELMKLLQEYSRRSRKSIEVYFDGAPAGHAVTRKFGLVTAHFISQHSSADAAIMARLRQLKRASKNWTVVTSDRGVMAAAAAAHASTESSIEFSWRLRPSAQPARDPAASEREGRVPEDEVQHWLNVFKKR